MNNSRTALRQNPRLSLFITTVVAGGFVVLAVALANWDGDDLPFVAALAVMACTLEYFDFGLYPNSRVSLSIGAITTAAVVGGFPAMAIVCTAAVGAQYAAHPKPLFKVAFNEGAQLLSGAAAIAAFRAFGTDYSASEWPSLLAAALLAATSFFVVNSSLVATAIAIDKRKNPVGVWSSNFSWIAPHYVLVGMIAAAMATAYDEWDLVGVCLPLVPLIVVWLILRQRVESRQPAPTVGAS